MNKKQKITLLMTIILLILVPMIRPQIYWKTPRTNEDKERVIREEKRLDKIYFFYGPFSIILVGGILLYIFRNKKQ